MSLSLHSATVASYLQILGSVGRLVDKAEEHCRASGLPDEALTGARLADDMWPFAKQVFECAHHSARAVAGAREGVFRPEIDPAPTDFAALKDEISGAVALLEAVTPEEMDGLADRSLRFEFGPNGMDFVVTDFLLSFSLPNFYFHATTTYDILRAEGLKVGKRDFIGRPRTIV